MEHKKPSLTAKDKAFLADVFHKSLPEKLQTKATAAGSCSCDGCSCPPESGNICDGATMVGYSGGYYGALSA